MSNSNIRVIIAEDDEPFGHLVQSILNRSGYETQLAGDGRSAQALLSTKGFNLLITDAKMPEIDGVALIRWCRTNQPQLPSILMSTSPGLLKAMDKNEPGLRAVLAKPFLSNELLAAVGMALSGEARAPEPAGASAVPVNEALSADFDEDYCRLSIEEFVTGKVLPFAIFIRLSSSKYVKIAQQGEDLDFQQVTSYRDKGVTHLFMKRDDFKRYLAQNMALSRSISKVRSIDPIRKLRFLKHTGEVLMEFVKAEGLNEERYLDARSFVTAVMENVSDREDLVTLLELLNAHSDSLYAHSLGVGLYAVMICQQLGWCAVPTTYTAMLAGLFHDIGKKEIDPDLLKTRRILLNQKQRSQLETHSVRGAEILQGVPDIPEEIMQVALQHHEDCAGYGYPRHLTKNALSPLSRLISVADIFCEYAIRSPDHPEGMPAAAAIQQIEQLRRERLDATFLAALKDAVLIRPRSRPEIL